MARTRTTKTTNEADVEPPKTGSKYCLPTRTGHAPKLFILPSKASAESRIVTLPHPRNGRPSRYLVCPESGIYELTKIAATKTDPRSWLIEQKEDEKISSGSAQTVPNGDIFVATSLDPLFLVLPSLISLPNSKDSSEQKRLFLSSDDHFDNLPSDASHLSEILRCSNTRKLLESRMWAVCDTVEAGDESMFRLNEAKLASVIWNKAKRLSDEGSLPSSIEEKFVKKALEAPMLMTRRDIKAMDSSVSAQTDSGMSTPKTENTDSQSSTATNDSGVSAASEASTAATSVSDEDSNGELLSNALQASEEILRQQRLRVGFEFICSSYVPVVVAQQIKDFAVNDLTIAEDFSALDEYIIKLNKARSDAVTARSAGDFSRKRARDEEEDEARLEKKRKLEEEKKRKANESRGVRDLKKVNTSGMKKMSDFFKKK